MKFIIVGFSYVNEKICAAKDIKPGSLRVNKRCRPGTNTPIVCKSRDEAVGEFMKNGYNQFDSTIIFETDYDSDHFTFPELMMKSQQAMFRSFIDKISEITSCSTSLV
jgi:hypothetical protein